MSNFITKYARWIAWLLLGLYIILIGTGLALQYVSGMQASGAGTPVPPIPIILTSWSIFGVLLVSRQPRNPIGWIFVIMPVIFGLDDFTSGYAYYGLFTHPDSLPFVEAAIVWGYWSGRAIAATSLTLLFLLFPSGRPMSPRWGKLAWFSILATIVYILSATISPLSLGIKTLFPTNLVGRTPAIQELILPLTFVSFLFILICTFTAIIALYLRLRQATGVERQQLKWFVFCSVFFIPGICMIILGSPRNTFLFNWVFFTGILLAGIAIAGIPIASTIAILRYRLWDIDIIVRRTLIYGVSTGLLVLIYFAIVTLLQNLVAALSGQESPAAIVISTLIIAALFNPLRNRIQNVIDRRFYRQKYDAAETLAQFAATAQEGVEIEPLTAELLRVVQKTLQPVSMSLWLKEE